MRFEQINDVKSRYQDTFILVDGKPFYVASVQEYQNKVLFKCSKDHNADSYTNIYPYDQDEERCLLDFSHTFYTVADGKVCFADRNPRRQWRQGFRPQLYTGVLIETERHRAPRSWNLRSGWPTAYDWADTNYVPLPDVEEHLELKKFATIAPDVAVLRDGKVVYKAKDIGLLLMGQVVVHSQGSWVQDHLRRHNIPHTVRNRSRHLLNKKVSLFELEQLGIDPAVLEQLEGNPQPVAPVAPVPEDPRAMDRGEPALVMRRFPAPPQDFFR